MSDVNSNADEAVECPLCMEPLEVDDLNFYPCTCGYQICRFCWHRIRTDENELCPACRKAYPENPADFTPLTQEEIIAFKSQKRQRDMQRKQKITENRKHLSNVRVVQKNLVFVVGLPPRLADADILRKHEYFGKYGKIHKVVINPSTTYAGVQGPSASAYVTYVHNSDALRAIQSVNNINIDGRPIKTSLGTTKYCSHFMKNQQCPKNDCMYLHELGDAEASFTKEEMHQGKHQEYEKRLHDTLLSSIAGSSSSSNQTSSGCVPLPNAASVYISNAVSTSASAQHKDAWPSLSVSPQNKESTAAIGKTKKERGKMCEKFKIEKGLKAKSKNIAPNIIDYNPTCYGNIQRSRDVGSLTDAWVALQCKKHDKTKPDKTISRSGREVHNREKKQMNFESQNKSAEDSMKLSHCADDTTTSKIKKNYSSSIVSSKIPLHKTEVQRSPSASSSSSIASSVSNNSCREDDGNRHMVLENEKIENGSEFSIEANKSLSRASESFTQANDEILKKKFFCEKETDENFVQCSTLLSKENQFACLKGVNDASMNDISGAISNLNLFDDNNSLFTSSMSALHKSLVCTNNLEADKANTNSHNPITSQLPDLLNEVQGALKSGIQQNTNMDEQQQLNHQNQLFKQLQQRKEIMRNQEILSKSSLTSSVGVSQAINPYAIYNTNISCNSDDVSCLLQKIPLQQQMGHQQLDHFPSTNALGMDMSKFFDFHKNQQQINQFALNGGIVNSTPSSNLYNAQIQKGTLTEGNRLNTRFLDQSFLAPQAQLQKQRQKFETLSSPHNIQPSVKQNQQIQQQPRVSTQFLQNTFVDDDLGFDPFIETQKALAELMENELVQQKHRNETSVGTNAFVVSKPQHQQQNINENPQRSRLPPPGFNNTNTIRFGPPRCQYGNNMLPVVNCSNTQIGGATWNSSFSPFAQHQLSQLNEAQMKHLTRNLNVENQSSRENHDWTTMDPAILSFRQFSFPQQSPMPSTFQQDLYVQNVPVQPNTQGSQTQINASNVSFSNSSMMSSQQNSPGQVNANVQGMLEYLKNRQFF